jgi:GNAT superfamily N-acetyltransferase
MTIHELEVPIANDRADSLLAFWEPVFGTSSQEQAPILAGKDVEHNQDRLFLAYENDQLAGTCHLTISHANPSLGGLGEVAVAPAFRRRGIAGALCARARDAFLAQGGEVLCLATHNPEAARVYHRLGWRKLAGANAMLWLREPNSPEEFLVDHFRNEDAVTVMRGTPADRLAMIPLLVNPHDWHILDANLGMFSTRYLVQRSCMGLYPRFAALRRNEDGDWWVARTTQHRVVGLATVRRDAAGRVQVDGFLHRRWLDHWSALIHPALHWAAERGAPAVHACVAGVDEEKLARFQALGFSTASPGELFTLDGVPAATTYQRLAAEPIRR